MQFILKSILAVLVASAIIIAQLGIIQSWKAANRVVNVFPWGYNTTHYYLIQDQDEHVVVRRATADEAHDYAKANLSKVVAAFAFEYEATTAAKALNGN